MHEGAAHQKARAKRHATHEPDSALYIQSGLKIKTASIRERAQTQNARAKSEEKARRQKGLPLCHKSQTETNYAKDRDRPTPTKYPSQKRPKQNPKRGTRRTDDTRPQPTGRSQENCLTLMPVATENSHACGYGLISPCLWLRNVTTYTTICSIIRQRYCPCRGIAPATLPLPSAHISANKASPRRAFINVHAHTAAATAGAHVRNFLLTAFFVSSF